MAQMSVSNQFEVGPREQTNSKTRRDLRLTAAPGIALTSPHIAVVAAWSASLRYLLLDRLLYLKEAGWQVTAICGDNLNTAHLRQAGLKVDVVPMVREPHPWHDLRSLIALIQYFRRNRFDVVATHTPKAGLLGPLAAKLAGVPLVVHTAHGLLFHDEMPLVRRFLGQAAERWTALFADQVFFQSQEDCEVARRMRLKQPGKLHWIGNGIDMDRFDPERVNGRRQAIRQEFGFDSDHFVVGTVGRLVWEKGFRELFQAAAIVHQQFPFVHFLVVGPFEDGMQHDAIGRAVLRDLPPYVVCAGLREDMPEIYSAMDLFVLPSYREGIPRALMEAMAMGVPAIATNIRGCREVIQADETGLLVSVRDSEDLAGAIIRLLLNSEQCGQFARRGQHDVRTRFSSRDVNERMAAIVEEALSHRWSGRAFLQEPMSRDR